jgi:hypothetical protein
MPQASRQMLHQGGELLAHQNAAMPRLTPTMAGHPTRIGSIHQALQGRHMLRNAGNHPELLHLSFFSVLMSAKQHQAFLVLQNCILLCMRWSALFVCRERRTSEGGTGRLAGTAVDAPSSPPRCLISNPSPRASPQVAAGVCHSRCQFEWIEPAVQKTPWKAFYSGLCGSSTGQVHCGDVVAVETPGNQIMIQVCVCARVPLNGW